MNDHVANHAPASPAADDAKHAAANNELAFSLVVNATGCAWPHAEMLRSIARQAHAKIEVVVVYSRPDQPAAINQMAVAAGCTIHRFMFSADTTRATAYNLGVAATAAPCVAILDCVCRLADDFVERALDTFSRAPQAAVVIPTRAAHEATLLAVMGAAFSTARDFFGSPWALPSAAPFRRSAWAAMGGFDETLEALEMWDFLVGLLARGYQCVLAPEMPRPMYPTAGEAMTRIASDTYLRCVKQITRKHRHMLAEDVGAVLGTSKRVEAMLRDRRDRAAREWTALENEAQTLAQEVERQLNVLRALGTTDARDDRSHPLTRGRLP